MKRKFWAWLSKLIVLLAFTPPLSVRAAPAGDYIAYDVIGQGNPLVLIHPFPLDQRLWALQVKGLKKHFKVIILDLWGFGNSSSTDESATTMQHYADELKNLLDALRIKKAIIAGESMGGYVALAFLRSYPQLVSGLVLSNTQAITDTEQEKQIREITAKEVLTQGSQAYIERILSKLVSRISTVPMRKELKDMMMAESTSGIASALRGMAKRLDLTPLLANTELPILIITSDHDALIKSEQSMAMHKLAKNSRLVTLTDAGHLSSFEQPTQWNKAVIKMFEKMDI